MRRKLLAALVAVAVSGTLVAVGQPASASSHREAPLISQDPVADNTDLWMFRDKVDPSKVNIIANYIGLEQPAAGPNFPRFADDVLYEIHVDNSGDVRDDISYQFRFRTVTTPNAPFYNTGQVTTNDDTDLNVKQMYSLRKVVTSGGTQTVTQLATDVLTPPVNVGPRSTPNYEASLAQPAVTTLPGGGKVFAGQRKDAFFFDIGSTFDLLALRPIQSNHLIPNPPSTPNGVDALAGKNVHTISLQLPITEVTLNHTTPTVVDSPTSFIGAYASASRQRVRVLAAGGGAPRNLGQYVQVSRLGLPGVNEFLIPLDKRDHWNASDPKDDMQFFANILDPVPTRLLPVVYPGVFNNTNTPPGGQANRPDLVKLLTGQLAGLSAPNALPPADLLRINLAVPPTVGAENREGVLGGQAAGFPNGRRLGDDVIDIAVQFIFAGVCIYTNPCDISQHIPGTSVPYSALGDGVNGSDKPFLTVFPYQATPISGYDQPPTG